MKRLRITAVVTVIGLITASCGDSSDSAPRQRNMAPATNVSLTPCVLGPNANCEGAYLSKGDTQNIPHHRKISLDWSGANLSGVVWDSADFVKVVMTNANLSSARLSRVNARSVSAVGTSFVNAKIHTLDGPITSPSQRIDGAGDFRKADFSYAELVNVSFRGAKLIGAKFFGTNLTNVDFTSANLTGVDLSSALLDGITGINIVGNPKLPTGWKVLNKNLIGPNSILRSDVTREFLDGVSPPERQVWKLSPSIPSDKAFYWLTRGTLTTCELPKLSKMSVVKPVGLSRAALKGVTISNIDFSGVDLTGTSFDGMSLENVNFSAANLTGATFRNATLKNVDFSYADISYVNFSTTKMSDIVSQCTFTAKMRPPVFPEGWKYVKEDFHKGGFVVARGILVGPGSDLSGKNLTGLDLSKVNLESANLSGVSSGQVLKVAVGGRKSFVVGDSQTELPEGYGIRGGVLIGPDVDLSHVQLKNVDLSGLSLIGARFEGLVTENIRGDVSLDESTKLLNGYLVAPGVNLSKVRLGVGDLTGVDLSESNLSEADLTGVTLDGVRSNGVIGEPALPVNWLIAGGIIFGPTADLSHSVFDATLPQRFSLDKIDLGKTKLDGSNIVGFRGTPIVPSGWSVVKMSFAAKNRNALIGPMSSLGYGLASNFPPTAQLPTGYVRLNGSIIGPHLDGTELNGLVGGEIDGVDFTDSTLRNIDFSQTIIRNAKGEGVRVSLTSPVRWPAGWGVLNETLVGPNADLSHQHLVEMDLSGIDLLNANLSMVRGRGLKFNQKTRLPVGWGIMNGVLMGPEADITDAYIAGVNLNGIDLSNANLSNVIMKRISGTPLLPDGYQIVRGTLVGEGVDIVCSDLLPKDVKGSNKPASRVSAMYSPERFGLKKATVRACL